MSLTQLQYVFLMTLAQSIPRTFATTETEIAEDEETAESAPHQVASSVKPPESSAPPPGDETTVDLMPELPHVARQANGQQIELWSRLEVAFNVQTVVLELYSAEAVDSNSLKSASVARFALNDTNLKLKMLTDGSLQSELALKSFTIQDTHVSKAIKWRDIIPAAKHEGHQLMLSYTMAGGVDRSAVADLTIDSPTVIFSLDPIFRLANFALSAFQSADEAAGEDQVVEPGIGDAEEPPAASPASSLAYRVNIVATKVYLLADPERNDSEAVVLSIAQILVSQQHILA